MQLQIYKIAHPLIKIILTRINTKYISEVDRNYYERYIGFLIIYEILRKYMIIKNVHIQLLEGTKKVETIDNTIKYIILTNTSDTYNMITDIKCITTNLEIIHMDYNNINNCIKKVNNNNKNLYIFIIEKITTNYRIINLIDYLKNNKNISLNQISIGNIFTNSTLLQEIGKKYPELKVYTTQVK